MWETFITKFVVGINYFISERNSNFQELNFVAQFAFIFESNFLTLQVFMQDLGTMKIAETLYIQ